MPRPTEKAKELVRGLEQDESIANTAKDSTGRLQNIGTLPQGGFGTVDVRSQFMLALEQALAPLMGQLLQNPFAFGQAAQNQANQLPFGAGGNDMLAHLFGSSPLAQGQALGSAFEGGDPFPGVSLAPMLSIC